MHDYKFLSSHGQDAPGQSLDTYSYCHKCGTLRHDYAHGGGLTSPSYPMFAAVGSAGWLATEPECKQVASGLRAALEMVMRDVGDGGPSSDYVSMYTVGQIRAALGIEADRNDG